MQRKHKQGPLAPSLVPLHPQLLEDCGVLKKSALPGKPLGQFSQAVQWVEVWALAISCQRLTVKLYPVYGFNARLIQVTEWREMKSMKNSTNCTI